MDFARPWPSTSFWGESTHSAPPAIWSHDGSSSICLIRAGFNRQTARNAQYSPSESGAGIHNLFSILSFMHKLIPYSLRSFLEWLFPRPSGLYVIQRVDEEPETLEKGIVYELGETRHEWAVVFVCPCGCDQRIALNLLHRSDRDIWTVQSDIRGRVTLHPSVWRQVGCRSHFIMRSGKINWC